MLFRVFAIGFAFVFALSMAVQYNDPDPLVWIALYGVVFGLSAAACFGRFWPTATAVVVAGYAIALALYVPALLDTSLDALRSIDMKSVRDEEVREGWGIAICLAWSVVLLVRGRRLRG